MAWNAAWHKDTTFRGIVVNIFFSIAVSKYNSYGMFAPVFVV